MSNNCDWPDSRIAFRSVAAHEFDLKKLSQTQSHD